MKNNQTTESRLVKAYALIFILVVVICILTLLLFLRPSQDSIYQLLPSADYHASFTYDEALKHESSSLEKNISDAKAILICQHTTRWRRIRCEITDIIMMDSNFTLRYQLGSSFPGHERHIKELRGADPGEGAVTFIMESEQGPTTSRYIHDGRVTKTLTLEQFIKIITNANIGLQKTLEDSRF